MSESKNTHNRRKHRKPYYGGKNKNKENSSPENEALAVEEKAENAEAAERMPKADIVSEKDVSLVKKKLPVLLREYILLLPIFRWISMKNIWNTAKR